MAPCRRGAVLGPGAEGLLQATCAFYPRMLKNGALRDMLGVLGLLCIFPVVVESWQLRQLKLKFISRRFILSFVCLFCCEVTKVLVCVCVARFSGHKARAMSFCENFQHFDFGLTCIFERRRVLTTHRMPVEPHALRSCFDERVPRFHHR